MSALIPRRANQVSLDAATLAALENVSIDNFPAIQTVDGEVSLSPATLAALEDLTVTVDNQLVQPLTDAQLRALPVPVSATNLDIRDLSSASDSITAVISGVPDVDTGLAQPLTDTELRASPVQVLSSAVHDVGNSTTTPLGSNAVFLGAAFDLTDYASWSVNVFTDQNSATNGFRIEWSDEGTNWDYSDDTTYEASSGNMVTFGRKAHYVRLRFTNSSVAQGVFRVESTAQPFAVRQTRKFIGDVVKDQDTGQVVVAAIQGKTTGGGGGYVPVKVAPSGALTVDTGLTQPLTDTQLRASAVPVSLASVPTHTVTDGGSGKTLKSASFSLAATGSIVASVASKRIKVYAVKLICSAAISVNFRSGGATALEGAQPIAANGGFIESVNPPSFLFGTTAGESLDLVISGAGTASGRISYWDDDNA